MLLQQNIQDEFYITLPYVLGGVLGVRFSYHLALCSKIFSVSADQPDDVIILLALLPLQTFELCLPLPPLLLLIILAQIAEWLVMGSGRLVDSVHTLISPGLKDIFEPGLLPCRSYLLDALCQFILLAFYFYNLGDERNDFFFFIFKLLLLWSLSLKKRI